MMDDELKTTLLAMEDRLVARIDKSSAALEDRLVARMDKSSAALEDRLVARMEKTEAALEERLLARIEETETKLLSAFHGWARPMEIRQRSTTSIVTGFDERLSLVEERVSQIERRKA
jgi:hypothetical protein